MGNATWPTKSTRSYLVVIHENSVCSGCIRPHPGLAGDYRIDIAVWSWSKGGDGLGDHEDPASRR